MAKTSDGGVVRGEFFTDGKAFVMRLAGSPISGTGESADAAFADLMQVKAGAGDLSDKLEALAKDQEGEVVRATLIRWVIAGFIALAIAGGVLVSAAALAPGVLEAIGASHPGVTVDQAPPKH